MGIQKQIVLSVRLTPTLKRFVDDAASASGLTTLDWIRAVLARAANEGAFGPRRGGRRGRGKSR